MVRPDRRGGGLIVVFVAVVLALLGALMIAGFVVLSLKLGALADELRDARTTDRLKQEMQLDAIADKQQGTRLDLDRLANALQTQSQSLTSLVFQLEGPQSMRRPILPSGDAQDREADNDPPDLAPPATASPQ